MPSTSHQGARERLIEAAVRLFGQEGIRAVGIDRLLAEAGVAKMSLYKHFRGKDDLVVVALRRKHDLFRQAFIATIATRREPRARLLGIFDALERWFARPDFRGCLFLNAASELPDAACPGRAAVAEHKEWVIDQLRSLSREAGSPEPDALADQLMLLFEGAIARAYVTGDPTVARAGRQAAAALLDASLGAEPSRSDRVSGR